jgi:NodT family efflux transporter outer membrane factor (OMF) lipoprotein
VAYRRNLIYPGLLLLITACATPEPSPTVEEVVEQAIPETTEIAQSFTEVPSWSEIIAEGAVKDGWLATFGDQELEKIVTEALQNNRDLAVIGANLEAAAALATQAGARLIPAVNIGGGAQSTDRGDNTTNTSGAALNMQWELDIWGKLSSAAAAAEESYRATEADLEAARQSLVAQTAKAWFLATEANLQLALSDEAVKIYEETLKIVETRVEVGAGSPQDAYLAKADLNAARERQRQATGALTQSVRSIEVILGRYPSAELETAREFVPTPPGIPVGLPAQLLERRPDLIAAERRVAAAFQRVEAARAAKLPSVALTASGGSSSNELIDLVGASGNFFSLGANFVAPLDLGGGLEAQVQIENSQQQAALANYGSIALRAFNEVETGLTNEQLLLEREAFLTAAVENNRDALVAAKSQYDAGAIDFLSVLQMQARTLNSRISLIRIKNARLAQRVDLHLALGGSFSE